MFQLAAFAMDWDILFVMLRKIQILHFMYLLAGKARE